MAGPGRGDSPRDTREAILDAAEAFLQHGRLRDMTVAALMSQLPVSREAFYKHFSSRYELASSLLGRFTDDVSIGFDTWLNGADPLRDVRAMFDAASHAYVRRAGVLRAVVDAAPLDPGLEAVWRSFIDAFAEPAAARIRQDQDRGIASRHVDAALAGRAVVHLVERVVTQELAGPGPPSRDQVVDVLTAGMLGMVYADREPVSAQEKERSSGRRPARSARAR